MRPILRYHGGKWMLAPWIISNFPKHRIYLEPYGGAASVLLQKPRSYAEVYNDLDGEVVNVFRVVRDRGPELVRALELTPFARDEYRGSFEIAEDPLEQARRTILRSMAGFASNALVRSIKTGFRNNANRAGTTPAHDWRNYPTVLVEMVERLRGVVIENTDALRLIHQHDSDETLHYCDPPYVHSARTEETRDRGYAYEMTDEQHREMATSLRALKGCVIVSGYASELYDELFRNWHRIETPAFGDYAKPRREVLWSNRPFSQGVLPL